MPHPEFTWCLNAFGDLTLQYRAGCHFDAFFQSDIAGVWIELHYAHGRDWRKKIWTDPVKQLLRETWKLFMQTKLNTRSQERETFQQAFHVGIVNFGCIHRQARCNFRETRRKLCPSVAHMGKFLSVKLKQARIHC